MWAAVGATLPGTIRNWNGWYKSAVPGVNSNGSCAMPCRWGGGLVFVPTPMSIAVDAEVESQAQLSLGLGVV